MIRTPAAASLLLGLAACTPHNAVLTGGEYWAFIGDTTSLSLQRDAIDPLDWDDVSAIDCRLWDEDGNLIQTDEAYLLDPSSKEFKDRDTYSESFRLFGADGIDKRLDICRGWAEDPTDPDQLSAYGYDAPRHEEWIVQAPYWVLHEPMDPWRGEAIITAEGDLQIGFHQHVPGGADMRFSVVVDPAFAPKRCEPKADGTVDAAPYDGDWIAEWTKDLASLADALGDSTDDGIDAAYGHYAPFTDGTLYYLNANSYQVNTNDPTCESSYNCYWYLPESWEAGFADAKFVEDNMHMRAARYGEPFVYNFNDSASVLGLNTQLKDLWYCGPDATTGALGRDAACNTTGFAFDTMGELVDHTTAVADLASAEASRIVTPNAAAFSLRPLVHDNTWRPADGLSPGMDAWTELHYNSIVFSADSDLSVGGHATGAFTLVFDGDNTATVLKVTGTFEIEKIKKDKWTTADLRSDKAEEVGINYAEDFCTIL